MRLKIREVSVGLHPSEKVVEVQTAKGTERLVVDRRAIEAGSLSIGAPIREKKDNVLVELPRETMSGAWRVWVNRGNLKTA